MTLGFGGLGLSLCLLGVSAERQQGGMFQQCAYFCLEDYAGLHLAITRTTVLAARWSGRACNASCISVAGQEMQHPPGG